MANRDWFTSVSEVRSPIRIREFRLDADVIRSGMEEKLTEADLEPLEKLRYVSALAGFRIAEGDPDRALELAYKASEIARELDDPIEVALASYGLDNVLYRCAALDKATEAYTNTVDLAVVHDQPLLAAQAMTGIGNCFFVVKQFDNAIGYYQVALTYFTKLNHIFSSGYIGMWLGQAYAARGKLKESNESFQQALRVLDQTPENQQDAERNLRGEVMARMAAVFASAGLRKQSEDYQHQARAMGFNAPVSMEP